MTYLKKYLRKAINEARQSGLSPEQRRAQRRGDALITELAAYAVRLLSYVALSVAARVAALDHLRPGKGVQAGADAVDGDGHLGAEALVVNELLQPCPRLVDALQRAIGRALVEHGQCKANGAAKRVEGVVVVLIGEQGHGEPFSSGCNSARGACPAAA